MLLYNCAITSGILYAHSGCSSNIYIYNGARDNSKEEIKMIEELEQVSYKESFLYLELFRL